MADRIGRVFAPGQEGGRITSPQRPQQPTWATNTIMPLLAAMKKSQEMKLAQKQQQQTRMGQILPALIASYQAGRTPEGQTPDMTFAGMDFDMGAGGGPPAGSAKYYDLEKKKREHEGVWTKKDLMSLATKHVSELAKSREGMLGSMTQSGWYLDNVTKTYDALIDATGAKVPRMGKGKTTPRPTGRVVKRGKDKVTGRAVVQYEDGNVVFEDTGEPYKEK